MSRPGWAGPSLCGTRTGANRPAARRAPPPRPTARTRRRRRQARGGRCRSHYLRSRRRARRARCLRGGQEIAKLARAASGETLYQPHALSSRSQTGLRFPPFVTVPGRPASATQALLRRAPRANFRASRPPPPIAHQLGQQCRRLEGRGLDGAKAGNWGTRDTHSLRR